MNANEEKQKVLPLSYGVKIGLGKTTLPRLIQQNTDNKVVLDLDAISDATTLINKFNDTK